MMGEGHIALCSFARDFKVREKEFQTAGTKSKIELITIVLLPPVVRETLSLLVIAVIAISFSPSNTF